MVRSKTSSITRIIIIALIFRLILVPLTFHGDVITNYWWGKFAVDFPLRGYFDWLNFGGYHGPDLPPLHILYHAGIRYAYLFIYKLLWFLNIQIPIFPSKFMQWYFDYGNQILSKIPSVIADLLILYFILKKFPQILKRPILSTLGIQFCSLGR